MKKKLYAILLGTGLALAAVSSVFAADQPAESANEGQAKAHAAGFGCKMHGKKFDLEKVAKEKGITVDELKKQIEQKREAKLAEIAKEKGITVEELKKQMREKRENHLAEMAKARGMSVDELKTELNKMHEAHLAALAKERGITIEELKKQLPNPNGPVFFHDNDL